MRFEPVVAGLGALEIDDDGVIVVGFFLMLDRGKGAEEEIAGVSHDGGATRSDLVAGEELEEFAEKVVNVRGGAKLLNVADEHDGEFGGVEVLRLKRSMAQTEAGLRAGDGHAATTAARRAMLAMLRCWCGKSDGGGWFGIHGRFLLDGVGMFHSGKKGGVPR